MKRVLIFSLAYYPRVGGAEVAIKEITDRIAPNDIAFDMVTLRFAATDAAVERVGNIVVHRVVGSKFLYPLTSAFKAHSLHRQKPYDALWAMMSYMVLPIALLRLVGMRVPYALTLQEGDTYEFMFRRLRILPFMSLMRRGYRDARVVSALSTFLAEWASDLGYRGEVAIIPNGADIQKFAGQPVAHDGVVLITSSRLVHKNGIDTVIRALPLLPDVSFVVCGAGPDEAALKALARDLKVFERVHFRGHVDHLELPRHLHHADIFVRPSRSEGFGASFAEAFAAGLPVIATQVGGLKDFISSDVAWPVRPDSPEDIAAAVRDIRSNSVRTKEVVKRAGELARAKYDWGIIAGQMRERVFAPVLE